MSLRNHTSAGYSLIELLVVMGIISLISVPLTSFMIRGVTSFTFLEAQSNTSLELNTLSARVTKVIRGTTGIDTAQPNTLILYGYFSPQDTVIKKIRYFISGTNLDIGVTPPTGTAPSYTYDPLNEVITTTRVDLVMGGQPLFTYYDDSGNTLSGAFNASQVKEVGLFISANPNQRAVPVPISLSTKVTLRNLKVNL
jgi:prepilin-type N-terminal cleavage/methylation domain-containing protein